MALPIDVSVDPLPPPGYFIYRDSPLGQYDPTAPPVFYPTKESDELFDALRIKFPLVKTHSERMRDAIIEFLMEERHAEALCASNETSPNMSLDQLENSPWQQSWPSMSSGSASTSPEMPDFATSFGDSPKSQPRQSSSAPGFTQPSTPQLEHMTGVFSLSSSAQPKQRLRRKMTEAEKIEYRKRRIVKACDKCAKRKRKCQHNQPEMEIVSSTKSASKVAKLRTSPSTKSVSTTTPKTDDLHTPFSVDSFSGDQSFATDIQLFDDFTTFFDEPLLDFDLPDEKVPFDNFLITDAYANNRPIDSYTHSQTTTHSSVSQWPWNESQDFTLLDFNDADHQLQKSSNPHNYPPGSLSARNTSDGVLVESASRQVQNSHDIAGGHQHNLIEIPQPTHTAHLHDSENNASFTGDSPGDSAGRPAKANKSPTHDVQRLTGIAEAVRSSGHLLSSQSSSSVQSAAPLSSVIESGIPGVAVVAHTRAQVPGRLVQDTIEAAPSRFKNGSLIEETREPFTWLGRYPAAMTPRLTGEELDLDAGSRPSMSRFGDGVLESTRAGGVIDAKKGDWAFNSVPGSRRSDIASAMFLQGATSDSQASTSVSGSSTSLPLGGVRAAQQGRRSNGLPGQDLYGQDVTDHDVRGVSQAANSATDLYRLKKRMSINLDKPQDHSTKTLPSGSTGLLPILPASSSVTSLLQTIAGDQVKEEPGSPVLASISEDRSEGGAYLRLDKNNCNQPSGGKNNCNQPSGGIARAEEDTPQVNGLSQDFLAKNRGYATVPQVDRLLDHSRFRDHHGRQSMGMGLGGFALAQSNLPKSLAASGAAGPALLIVLAAACLVASMFRFVDLSLVAFALVVPLATENAPRLKSLPALSSPKGAQQEMPQAGISTKNMKAEDWLS